MSTASGGAGGGDSSSAWRAWIAGLNEDDIRHYRHVALTLMHRVGCTQEAKDLSTHAEGSMTYAKSHCIPHIDPDFEKRFQDLDGNAAFAQLRACERLLL